MKIQVTAATILLALSACATPVDAPMQNSAPAAASALAAYTWQVKSGPISLSDTDRVVLTFRNDGTFSVAGLCNQMGGGYTDVSGKITFSNVTSTMMACHDERKMRLEAEVGGALQKSASAMMSRSEPPQLHLNFDQGSHWTLQGSR